MTASRFALAGGRSCEGDERDQPRLSAMRQLQGRERICVWANSTAVPCGVGTGSYTLTPAIRWATSLNSGAGIESPIRTAVTSTPKNQESEC